MLTSLFSMGQVVATSFITSLMSSDLSFHTFIYMSVVMHIQFLVIVFTLLLRLIVQLLLFYGLVST